jgi:hypothetical protein
VLLLGAFTLAALPIFPTAKSHYFALAPVAVLGLFAADWERCGRFRIWPGRPVLFGLYLAVTVAGLVDGIMRELGAVTWANVLLWSTCVRELWRDRRRAGDSRDGLPARGQQDRPRPSGVSESTSRGQAICPPSSSSIGSESPRRGQSPVPDQQQNDHQ